MIKIDGSILNVLHPRVKNELKRLSNVEDKLESKVEELNMILEGERAHSRSVQDDYKELLQDNTRLDLKNDELFEKNSSLESEIERLRNINCCLTEKYAMKCKSRAEACAPVQNWTKLKFKIKGRFVYSTPKIIDETTVILDDIEKLSIREVLERMFNAEDQVSELQAKLEKMTTQKESIWDIEEPWFEYQLQNRNKVLKIRYCENNMGKFVDSRIFENGHPTRKGLCIAVNDFDEFSKYMQKTNTKVKKLSQWGY